MKRYGFLAIWCDMAAEDLENYRNWLTREHIADRTVLPGFLGVRLFEALNDERSHFILYATAGPEILNGEAYRRVLDNPSEWTRHIMPKFGPFDRALGEQVLKTGNGFGSHVAVWRLRGDARLPDLEKLKTKLAPLSSSPGIAGVRLFAVDHGTTDRHSTEKTMRGGVEGDFQFLLCAEAMGEGPVRNIQADLTARMADLLPGLAIADCSCRRMIYGEAAHEASFG